MPESWNWANLEDTLKTARERFFGKRVRVHGGGMIAEGVLLGVTSKREAVIQTDKRGVQGISPLERIELLP